MFTCIVYHNGLKYLVDVNSNEQVAGVISWFIEDGEKCSDRVCSSGVDLYLSKRILNVARDHVKKRSDIISATLLNMEG